MKIRAAETGVHRCGLRVAGLSCAGQSGGRSSCNGHHPALLGHQDEDAAEHRLEGQLAHQLGSEDQGDLPAPRTCWLPEGAVRKPGAGCAGRRPDVRLRGLKIAVRLAPNPAIAVPLEELLRRRDFQDSLRRHYVSSDDHPDQSAAEPVREQQRGAEVLRRVGRDSPHLEGVRHARVLQRPGLEHNKGRAPEGPLLLLLRADKVESVRDWAEQGARETLGFLIYLLWV